MRDVGVADKGSENEAAGWAGLNATERETVDVDDLVGTLDVELHEIDKGGASGNEANLRALLGG